MTSGATKLSIEGLRRRLRRAADDRQRAELLVVHLPHVVALNPVDAIELADELVEAALGCRLPGYAAQGRIHKAGVLRSLGRTVEAAMEYARAHELLTRPGLHRDDPARARAPFVALTLGEIEAENDHPAEAIRWYLTAIETAPLSDHRLRVQAFEALGHLYSGLGDYARGLEFQFACLAAVESEGSRDEVGVVLTSIGTTYAQWGDPAQASAYLNRAVDTFRETGNRYLEVQAIGNLSSLSFSIGALPEALELALKAGTIYEALGDRAHAAASLVTVGNIYERQGDLDGALHCYARALRSVENGTDQILHATVLHNLGNVYRVTGALNDAQFVFEQALGIAQELEDPRLEAALRESLSHVFEELDLPAQALEHQRQYTRLREQLAGLERQKAIAELQVRFDVERAARERELFRARAEELENEMERKQSELNALALNLVQKNELLDSLREQIALLKNGGAGEPSTVDRVLAEIQGHRDPGKDWEILESQLNLRNPELIQRLLARCPSLTPTELKVCCLTSLDLGNKDIATLLFASERTVESHRLNIRRKLELPPRSNLAAFLSSL